MAFYCYESGLGESSHFSSQVKFEFFSNIAKPSRVESIQPISNSFLFIFIENICNNFCWIYHLNFHVKVEKMVHLRSEHLLITIHLMQVVTKCTCLFSFMKMSFFQVTAISFVLIANAREDVLILYLIVSPSITITNRFQKNICYQGVMRDAHRENFWIKNIVIQWTAIF